MRVSLVKTVVTLVGAMGLSAGATAADLAAPISTLPPDPVPPAFSWTGPYAGLNVGYAIGRLQTRANWAGWPPVTTPNSDFLEASGLRAGKDRKNSFAPGGQVGYNLQMGQVILGLEGDLSSMNLRRNSYASASYQTEQQDLNAAARSGQALHWVATVRPRVGWAFTDRLMVYGTGGLAVARASQWSRGVAILTSAPAAPAADPAPDPAADPAADAAAADPGSDAGTDTAADPAAAAATEPTAAEPTSVTSHFGVVGKNGSGYRVGWAIGAGAEYAITDDLSLKGEFLHVNVQGRSHVAASQETPTLGTAFVARNSSAFQIFKAGINYRF